MTFPKALARRIDRLNGNAHSYACDYAAWRLEGGREPEIDAYVNENDPRFSHVRALKIAAEIRQAVRP